MPSMDPNTDQSKRDFRRKLVRVLISPSPPSAEFPLVFRSTSAHNQLSVQLRVTAAASFAATICLRTPSPKL